MSRKRLVPLNAAALTTAPATGSHGDLYYNVPLGKFYGHNGTSWFEIGAGGGGGFTASDTAPAAPSAGDGWFDTTTGLAYIYYDGYWIEISGSTIGGQWDIDGGSVDQVYGGLYTFDGGTP